MAKRNLVECRFLIPLRSDAEISDGELHDFKSWGWPEEELMERFDGWGKATESIHGAWRSRVTGKAALDTSRPYYVALSRRRLKDLRKLLRLACGEFAQQCIYLSVAGDVEMVEAPPR
jgi:hypothetical protein